MIESIDVGGTVNSLAVGMSPSDLLKCTWFDNTLRLQKGISLTDITVPQLFQTRKWFFMEIGSTNSGYYGSLRFKIGIQQINTISPSGYLLTGSHTLYYPQMGSASTFTVRAK
jgi:hypothetical protein